MSLAERQDELQPPGITWTEAGEGLQPQTWKQDGMADVS
jgi:hypothetical protein